MSAAYPPDEHVLRDLRLSFENDRDARRGRTWMPIVPEICSDAGHARAGVLATLVDVIGGGLAARAARPGWIATADLTLHVVGPARPGTTVEARASVLRVGRTTVVLNVELVDEAERAIGLATMSFSVLPRRDINPDIDDVDGPATTAWTSNAGLRVPLADMLRAQPVDASPGELLVPITDWGRNSMGAMQGGVVAMVADLAAEHSLRATTGMPLVVADMHLTYLGFGRTGPVRTTTRLLGAARTHASARVDIVDTGAENRHMTTASVLATRFGG